MNKTTDNNTEKKEVIETQPEQVQVIPGFGSKESFEFAMRAANLLAKSSLVPKEYQGNLPNCVIALNMASRMGADPLMVMQNLHVINGRPGWSSQFLISTFNTCGRYTALRYEWTGQKGTDSWGCRAWAIERATGEKLVGPEVTIKTAKDEGWYDRKDSRGAYISKWRTMPQLMLMYRAAAWFIRAYAPELAMGMHTAEEIVDTIDVENYEAMTKDYDEVAREVAENANKEPIDIPDQDPHQPEPTKGPEQGKKQQETSQPSIFQEAPPF